MRSMTAPLVSGMMSACVSASTSISRAARVGAGVVDEGSVVAVMDSTVVCTMGPMIPIQSNPRCCPVGRRVGRRVGRQAGRRVG